MNVADPQAAVPKCKLRWYQYGLRSLLALTTAVAVMLGVVMMIAPYVRKARDLGRSRSRENKVIIGNHISVAMPKGSARVPSAANTGQPQSRPAADQPGG